MFYSNPDHWTDSQSQRRRHVRHDIHCRARIRVANRHYAGYLHNISPVGAKLRTITPIGRVGAVFLRLPDLPPLKCALKWSDHYNAGVMFGSALSDDQLLAWLQSRRALGSEVEIEGQL